MSEPLQRRSVTSIADLARYCGLSEGTVSRALNNYPDIALKTRERVQQAAKQFGYQPSSTARRLARGVVETIGFVLPGRSNHLSDPFLAEILDGLAAELAVNDWDLLLAAVPDEHDEIAVMDRLIRSGKVGGFAVTRVRREDPRVDFLRGTGIPFVVYGRTENHDNYSWLDIDNEKAFIDAVSYLAEMGHRDIGLLGGDLTLNHAYLRKTGLSGRAQGPWARDARGLDCRRCAQRNGCARGGGKAAGARHTANCHCLHYRQHRHRRHSCAATRRADSRKRHIGHRL